MAAKLRFNADGSFRIMLMGDPHESYHTDSVSQKKTRDFLVFENAALDELQPDLVVYMGDNTAADTCEDLRRTIERITRPIRSRGVPLGVIFGNHDFEAGVSDPEDHIRIYAEYEGSLFPEKAARSGRNDYNAVIRASDDSRNAFNLWFMYSGNHAAPEYHSKYDFVNREQIAWYESRAAALQAENGGAPVPAMLFQHIPVPEEFELLKKVSPLRLPIDAQRGQDERSDACYALDRSQGVTGYMGEAPCATSVNSGQFDSWLKMGDVVAAFFGHDHMNDFIGNVRGVTLGQCKLSGFRPYGDGLRQAVRVIDLHENTPTQFDTYMVRYRDLVGDRCQSATGPLRLLNDRQRMTLEFCLKTGGVAAAAAGVCAAFRLLKNRRT